MVHMNFQFSSVTESCPNFCDLMDCSIPGLPVHHQLPECTQTHVHWVCGATQPSHALLSPSPPAFNLSQHQGLLKWVSSTHQAYLAFTIFQSFLKFMSIESIMPSNHLILCCPLLLLPSIFPSIKLFSNESVLCIRWPKYWSFNISPSMNIQGLISFRID